MRTWRHRLNRAGALLLLMTAAACSQEPLTVTGQVVDEAGTALSDVAVQACYSGWGRSSGQLVWDKNYCSATVQTNRDGRYVITFKGPVSSNLRASKQGWVQTQDFNTTQARIVLTKSADYSSRSRAEAEQRELQRRRRLPGESDPDYYCRVVSPGTRGVNLNYQDEALAITPALLGHDGQGDVIFAVRGSSRAVNAFASEAVLKINGETPGRSLSLLSDATSCDADVRFIAAQLPEPGERAEARVEILVPSLSAMFDMQRWSSSTQR